MIKRVVLPPYDKYELSTFAIHNDTVYIGHFGAGGATVEEQLENTLISLKKSLEEIDLGLENVVKLTVILKDIKDFNKTHAIWCEYFEEGNYPARVTVTSDFIDENCLVQIEGTACFN
ncbi:Enamine deaminase RidA, house cleaning of reactive enamine intermediates, YjgF/YER057c/UK114 family [Evansella caseinilytica]|uniref:Enamine deaminase RidA, house cleaning of reactive enamine intermediates, YjgF/YER057c/UK114 family n=1 Tax=Evansella caseinilytica TaxID=1503961 RepID=A0A1H3H7R5_9BACI|nr:RidA family protein [Evansella caseinilytica]SDY11380.1 Enamine deaminase RidA, house cleaning of reactive enamine intermediates, YjgF/YER057c/UK114 family [Evansella caseinilytica]